MAELHGAFRWTQQFLLFEPEAAMRLKNIHGTAVSYLALKLIRIASGPDRADRDETVIDRHRGREDLARAAIERD
jgi:hypothetical protein